MRRVESEIQGGPVVSRWSSVARGKTWTIGGLGAAGVGASSFPARAFNRKWRGETAAKGAKNGCEAREERPQRTRRTAAKHPKERPQRARRKAWHTMAERDFRIRSAIAVLRLRSLVCEGPGGRGRTARVGR